MIEHNMNAPLGPSSRAVAKEGTKGAPIGMEGRGGGRTATRTPKEGTKGAGIGMERRGGGRTAARTPSRTQRRCS